MADIHANREAFAACLADARDQGATHHALLGDYVGYGADPVWVVEEIMTLVSRGAAAVRGNHDHAVADRRQTMNPDARAALDWTRDRLAPGHRAFLESLPFRVEEEDRFYVHAGGRPPGRWGYVVDAEDAAGCLGATAARLVACGHVHIPALYQAAGAARPVRFRPVPDAPVPLLRRRRWVVVLGSVGQPRDGDPSACYALLDAVSAEIVYRRVPYDVAATQAKIRAAGLPDALAQRLAEGR